MSWLDKPQDFFVRHPMPREMERFGLSEGDLCGGHYSHPSEPEDFCSGPVLIIRNATYHPDDSKDGLLMYEGQGVFRIGSMRYRDERYNGHDDDIACDGYLKLVELEIS